MNREDKWLCQTIKKKNGQKTVHLEVRKKKIKTTNLGLFALTFSIVMIMFFMKSGNNFVNLESPNILMYIILGLVGYILYGSIFNNNISACV